MEVMTDRAGPGTPAPAGRQGGRGNTPRVAPVRACVGEEAPEQGRCTQQGQRSRPAARRGPNTGKAQRRSRYPAMREKAPCLSLESTQTGRLSLIPLGAELGRICYKDNMISSHLGHRF